MPIPPVPSDLPRSISISRCSDEYEAAHPQTDRGRHAGAAAPPPPPPTAAAPAPTPAPAPGRTEEEHALVRVQEQENTARHKIRFAEQMEEQALMHQLWDILSRAGDAPDVPSPREISVEFRDRSRGSGTRGQGACGASDVVARAGSETVSVVTEDILRTASDVQTRFSSHVHSVGQGGVQTTAPRSSSQTLAASEVWSGAMSRRCVGTGCGRGEGRVCGWCVSPTF